MNHPRYFHTIRSNQGFQLVMLIVAGILAASMDAPAYTNTFDTAASTNGWVHWWGGAMEIRTFDPNTDANGNPSSGSMQVRVPYSRSLGGDNQFSMWGSFSGIPNSWTASLDGSQFASLEMDILWDEFSVKIPSSGNYGSDFHYGFAVGAPVYGQIDFQNHLTIAASDAGHWIHLSAPINPSNIGTNITNIVGIWFKMWTGNDPTNSLDDGEAIFWVDNIKLVSVPPPPPPTPDYTNTFNSANAINGWTHWWGGAMETREFDATRDADGNTNSGSMKVTVPYSLSLADNQFSMWGSFSGTPGTWGIPLDGTLYTNLEMDVYWDPNSARRPATGDYGSDFRYGFAVGAPVYGQISFNNHTVISTNDVGHWFHLSAPIDLTTVGPNITNIVGVWIKMWTGNNSSNSLDGPSVFWIDNIRLRAKATNAPPIQPPTMAIEKAAPSGLRLFASAPGSQYQRQGIRTLNPNYSWVGALDPVTYSINIAAHPGVPSFQTHMFLVPGSPPATQSAPDYTEPNVVFLDIQANANGTAFANFRYKTNEPNANSFLYSLGTIAGVGSSTVLGTWNLTFNPGGTISLTSPSGGTTNFTMPSEAVALFGGSLYAYFGIQPNQPANIGLSATLGHLQITGVASPINEGFTTPTLNPETWQIVAEHAPGVIPVPPDALFWLTWSVPDTGFKLQTAFGLPGVWSDLANSNVQLGARKRVLIFSSGLPASDTGNYFFRMTK